MDYQELQGLEKVYCFLSKYPKTNIDQISENLQISINQVLDFISELKVLGLDISIISNKIHLNNKVDVIDPVLIKNQLQKCNINKKVFCEFITHSTNQLAQANKQDAIFISNYQSQGKGRQAKKWLTPLGQSIAISISHRFNFGLQKLSGLNIAIGIAIIQTLEKFGAQKIGLKWPNDIIDSNGKIAGILIEASGNTKSSRAIIGIGINWNIRQELFEEIDQPCSNVAISSISRTQFIIELLQNINQILKEFTKNNLRNIQSIWQQYDMYLNKKINVIQGDIIRSATYKGIDQNGLLTVEIENKLKTIASGEVSIRVKNS